MAIPNKVGKWKRLKTGSVDEIAYQQRMNEPIFEMVRRTENGWQFNLIGEKYITNLSLEPIYGTRAEIVKKGVAWMKRNQNPPFDK